MFAYHDSIFPFILETKSIDISTNDKRIFNNSASDDFNLMIKLLVCSECEYAGKGNSVQEVSRQI